MQIGDRKRMEWKVMLDEIRDHGFKKPLPKCCGQRMKVVLMDLVEETASGKEVLSHNTPIFMCETCGGSEIQLEVAVLVEELCEAGGLMEIDFNEIETLIEQMGIQ